MKYRFSKLKTDIKGQEKIFKLKTVALITYSYCYILGFFYSLNKLIKMKIEDIEVIVMIVQFKDGSAHQVLTSKENKKIALQIIASADGKLTLDKELAPVVFEYAE